MGFGGGGLKGQGETEGEAGSRRVGGKCNKQGEACPEHPKIGHSYISQTESQFI